MKSLSKVSFLLNGQILLCNLYYNTFKRVTISSVTLNDKAEFSFTYCTSQDYIL